LIVLQQCTPVSARHFAYAWPRIRCRLAGQSSERKTTSEWLYSRPAGSTPASQCDDYDLVEKLR